MPKKRPIPGLSLLNQNEKRYPATPAEAKLEAFPNRHPGRDYVITLDCPEFTSLCPITSQPDFGELTIEYVADTLCVESKSLKLYLFAYRNHGAFHEEVVNLILDDLVALLKPRRMTVSGRFRPRGGIAILVKASHAS